MIFMLTSEQRLSAIQRLGRALSDPTRCRLLLALLEGPDYPAGLADRLGLTRQNVSNHLACLRDCGLVRTHARGRQVSYELVDASLVHALFVRGHQGLVGLRGAPADIEQVLQGVEEGGVDEPGADLAAAGGGPDEAAVTKAGEGGGDVRP